MNKVFLTLLALLTLASSEVFVQITPAQAATPAPTYTALEPLPCIPSAPTKDANGQDIPGTGVICTGEIRSQFNFSDYVQFILNLLIAVSASAAVFMIVWGGFQYMTSYATGGKNEGLDKVKGALTGLLLVLTSYMIIRTVNPSLVAIPTTLVEPLHVTYTKNADLDFFDELAQDALAYHTDQATFAANRAKAQQNITDATNQQARTEDEIRQIYGDSDLDEASIDDLCRQTQDAEIRALCTQRSAAVHAKAEAQSTLIYNTAKAAMRSSMEQCWTITSTPSSFQCYQNKGVQSDINKIYSKYSGQINSQQQQELRGYALYVRAYIQMGTLYTNPDISQAETARQLKNVVDVYSHSPSRIPELQEKLTEYLDVLITKLGKL